MLKPAYLYKDELDKLFASVMYDDDYFLYMGYPHGHELPKIEPKDNVYQWAIVSENTYTWSDNSIDDGFWITTNSSILNTKNEKVIGYFSYQIQPETDTALNFGLYSFDKGNALIGCEVYHKMKKLAETHRRLEWRVIGGNPVEKAYDRFCEKYGGNKVTFHKVVKDIRGMYRDEHVYEILR